MLGGRYQRGPKVGVDSLGTIFQGYDAQTQQQVLLQYLEASASDSILQDLIQGDAQSRWADLPGRAPLLAYTRDPQGGRAVLIRAGIPGQPLTVTFSKRPIGPGQAVWLGESLLSALHELHASGRVHGAVGPDVVWVEPTKWTLRLVQPLPWRADVAAPPRNDQDALAYMAPEVIADAEDARPESDIYAVGALLYRALSGRTHIRARTNLERFQAIREGRFQPLLEVAPKVERELALSIEQALRPDPLQRHRTAVDFRRSLAYLREHPPI